MAKPSLTSQFDAIQARLAPLGEVIRSRFCLRIDGRVSFGGVETWPWYVMLEMKSRNSFTAYMTANHLRGVFAEGDTPEQAIAELAAKPFGRTTIGAVFGITPD
jgi:hypothetical protein